MKTVMPQICTIAWVCAAFMAAGCRESAVHRKTITALEGEVSRLRAERANLDARSAALDDKLLVLEKRLEKCRGDDTTGLSVVKLSPDASSDRNEGEGIEAYESDPGKRSGDEKRPVLVLNERRRRAAPSGAAARVREGLGEVPNASAFSDLGADNLGVVESGLETSARAPSQIERSAMDRFNEAYKHYSNKDYDKALDGFAAFVNANPGHEFADNAIYWRGECYLASGRLPNAIGEFRRMMRRYPESEKAAASIYRIGVIYDKMRDYGKAAEHYYDVVERYPGTDEARRASRRVAELRNNGEKVGLMPTSATR